MKCKKLVYYRLWAKRMLPRKPSIQGKTCTLCHFTEIFFLDCLTLRCFAFFTCNLYVCIPETKDDTPST